MDIILYLLQLIQQLYKQNCWLINFICKYIPLKQWAYDDSHSPKYQKFKIDELPLILNVEPWDYRDFMAYLKWRGRTTGRDDSSELFLFPSADVVFFQAANS